MNKKEMISFATRGFYSEVQMNFRRGNHTDSQRLMKLAKERIFDSLRWRNGHSPVAIVDIISEKIEIERYLSDITPELEEAIQKIILRAQKAEKVKSISSTAATTMMIETLKGNGITDFQYQVQCYRLMLWIAIGHGKTMRIPIRYKQAAQDIENIMPSYLQAKQLVERHGKDFCIS